MQSSLKTKGFFSKKVISALTLFPVIFTLTVLFTNCAPGSSDSASSAGDTDPSSANATNTPISSLPSVTITCPANLAAGSAATCSATTRGSIVSGYWTVNGAKVEGSDNQLSYTWAQAPAGNFQIQVVAKDSNGATVKSNIVTVSVSPGSGVSAAVLEIQCPASALAGTSVTCSVTTAQGIVSGFWTVNGVKVAGSDNSPSYTWNQVPAGVYHVQAHGVDLAGQTVSSSLRVVSISP